MRLSGVGVATARPLTELHMNHGVQNKVGICGQVQVAHLPGSVPPQRLLEVLAQDGWLDSADA